MFLHLYTYTNGRGHCCMNAYSTKNTQIYRHGWHGGDGGGHGYGGADERPCSAGASGSVSLCVCVLTCVCTCVRVFLDALPFMWKSLVLELFGSHGLTNSRRFHILHLLLQYFQHPMLQQTKYIHKRVCLCITRVYVRNIDNDGTSCRSK